MPQPQLDIQALLDSLLGGSGARSPWAAQPISVAPINAPTIEPAAVSPMRPAPASSGGMNLSDLISGVNTAGNFAKGYSGAGGGMSGLEAGAKAAAPDLTTALGNLGSGLSTIGGDIAGAAAPIGSEIAGGASALGGAAASGISSLISALGPLLALLDDGGPVALPPTKAGLSIIDNATGRTIPLTQPGEAGVAAGTGAPQQQQQPLATNAPSQSELDKAKIGDVIALFGKALGLPNGPNAPAPTGISRFTQPIESGAATSLGTLGNILSMTPPTEIQGHPIAQALTQIAEGILGFTKPGRELQRLRREPYMTGAKEAGATERAGLKEAGALDREQMKERAAAFLKQLDAKTKKEIQNGKKVIFVNPESGETKIVGMNESPPAPPFTPLPRADAMELAKSQEAKQEKGFAHEDVLAAKKAALDLVKQATKDITAGNLKNDDQGRARVKALNKAAFDAGLSEDFQIHGDELANPGLLERAMTRLSNALSKQ